MIPAKDRLVDVDNLPGEEIEFGIGDPRWVMKTQAELYSDITTAIIREYSTNAYDANVMAGNPDPIQVTLPTVLNPTFVVEDKGVGMDMKTFRKVYTQFGISDKRGSNKTNGMLGYGSKSGIAYTTQFQVTTVKDGVKLEAVIQRKPDWRIVLKVVSQERTTEPNGTRISIPVHNVEEFCAKAEKFYRFWLPGRVVINGKPSKHWAGDKIMDGLYYSPDNVRTSYVVMGNVAYRINNPAALFTDNRIAHINFVAYRDEVVDEHGEKVAAVEFTPSREDLAYTDHTKRTLHMIVKDFEREILAKAQADVDNAKDHSEAFMKWQEWRGRFAGNLFNELVYKGQKVEPTFELPENSLRYSINKSHHYSRAVSGITQYDVLDMPSTMIVTGYHLSNVHSNNKVKVKEFARQKGWNIRTVLFIPGTMDDIVSVWIPRDKVASYPDIVEATKTAPAVVASAGRVAGSWDYWHNNGHFTEEKFIPTEDGVKVLYVNTTDVNNYYGSRNLDVATILSTIVKDPKVVVLKVPGNRHGKLLRENPHLVHLRDYVEKNVVAKMTAVVVPDYVQAAYHIPYHERRWFEGALKLDKLDDPMFAEIKRGIDDQHAVMLQFKEQDRVMRSIGRTVENLHIDRSKSREGEIYKKYPLLRHINIHYSGLESSLKKELYFYINTRFKEAQNG